MNHKHAFTIFLACLISTFAFGQNYVKQVCGTCSGSGRLFSGYYNAWGQPIFMPCGSCQGMGFILVPTGGSVPFQHSKLVSLKSKDGGVTHGSGTFYSESMLVVLTNGTRLSVSNSDSRKWKYMIKFSNGEKWYFD